MEIWKNVKGFERLYEVSNMGNVRSKKTGLTKKQRLSTWKYMTVKVCDNGQSIHKTVHRLVAESFIGNPENKEQVNHINGIKTDNRLINLEWVTRKENVRHAYELGLKTTKTHFKQKGEEHYRSKYSEAFIKEIKIMFKEGKKVKEVKSLTGISTRYLYLIKTGDRWGHVEV